MVHFRTPYKYSQFRNRKSNIGNNLCADEDGGKPFAVFQHTFYTGRWYYAGYTPFATEQEAEDFQDKWLSID